jgi:hypothetical protein
MSKGTAQLRLKLLSENIQLTNQVKDLETSIARIRQMQSAAVPISDPPMIEPDEAVAVVPNVLTWSALRETNSAQAIEVIKAQGMEPM